MSASPMLITALAVAAALAPGDTSRARPRGAAAAQDAPAIVVHHQPAIPVVALRLSLLADDPSGLAGAGHLFQHLLLPSLEEQVARVGGKVSAVRGSDAIVYEVVGPASELDYLAGALRSVLRPPQPDEATRLAAFSALADERAAERETARSYVRAALRAQLYPDDLPAAGTEASAGRLRDAPLDEVWRRMYAPQSVRILAVGDVEIDAVRRAFRDLPPGASVGGETGQDTVPALEADTPQATRGWIGAAWPADSADPAAVSVAARLLRNTMRRRMLRSNVEVEQWWTHHGQALTVVVATPDSLVPAARRSVDGALATLASAVTAASVRDAAEGLRRDLLFYARTPERMAELLGEFADRGGEDDAAQRYLAALDALTDDDVLHAVEQMRAATPATVFVPPQKIPEAQRRR